MTKWTQFPNLRHRPPAPNKGRGRLQAAVKRAFVVGGSDYVVGASMIWPLSRPLAGSVHGNRRWIWIGSEPRLRSRSARCVAAWPAVAVALERQSELDQKIARIAIK